MPAIRVDDSDGVRRITFSRPEKLNALTPADLLEATDQVRTATTALVFSGAGDRAFSAGMHLDSFAGLDPAGARSLITTLRDFLAAVRTCRLPTAAMINGYCLGAAFELALACDIRVAVDTAFFGLPEVKVGIPSVVDAALLQQYAGLGPAKEIILTGDLYPAARMLELGVLNRVVAADRLIPSTLELLGRISRHTPTVLASQKRLFETWQNTPLSTGIDLSVEEFAAVFGQPETLRQVEKARDGLA